MWIAIAAVLLIVLAIPLIRSVPGLNELKSMEIADVDFKRLRDGTFEGRFRGSKDSFRDVSVEVKVSSGAVTKIKVKKDALDKRMQRLEAKNASVAGSLFDKVIKAQSLKVDAVSGATLTCKAHLKAIENALEKAKIKE